MADSGINLTSDDLRKHLDTATASYLVGKGYNHRASDNYKDSTWGASNLVSPFIDWSSFLNNFQFINYYNN